MVNKGLDVWLNISFEGDLEKAHAEYKEHRKRGKLFQLIYVIQFCRRTNDQFMCKVLLYSHWGALRCEQTTSRPVSRFVRPSSPREEKTKWMTPARALPPQTHHGWRCLLTDTPDRCNAGVTASNFHAWLFFFHRRQLFRGSPPTETDRY